MKYFIGGAVLVAALVIAVGAWADVIVLTNGDRVEGKIVEETESIVKIETEFGPITLAKRGIKQIIREGPVNAEYKEKAKELAKEHVKLGLWCNEKGLGKEARKHFEMALKFDPDNEDARKALGYVKKDDKWVKKGQEPQKEPEKEPQKEPAGRLTRAERQKLHRDAEQKLQNKEYDEAEKLYLKIVKSVPKDYRALYNLACVYSLTNKKAKAIDYLKQSVKAGFTNAGHMQKDADLDNIREMEEFKKLIQEMLKRDKRNM